MAPKNYNGRATEAELRTALIKSTRTLDGLLRYRDKLDYVDRVMLETRITLNENLITRKKILTTSK